MSLPAQMNSFEKELGDILRSQAKPGESWIQTVLRIVDERDQARRDRNNALFLLKWELYKDLYRP